MTNAQDYLQSHMGKGKSFYDGTFVSVPTTNVDAMATKAYNAHRLRNVKNDGEQNALLSDKALITNIMNDISDDKCKYLIKNSIASLDAEAQKFAKHLVGQRQSKNSQTKQP
jgi:hypothetical protein